MKQISTPYQNTVNYVTGCQEPPSLATEIPELFVQGGSGRLKADLRGLGVTLHPDAFALSVPDNSMRGQNICRGDVAIVEPCVWELQEGDLLMVSLDGIGTLRRLTYREGIAYLEGDDGQKSDLLPLWEYAISGIATAILRLFHHGLPLTRSPKLSDEEKRADRKRTRRRETLPAQRPIAKNRLRDDPPDPADLGWFPSKRDCLDGLKS